MKLSNLFILPLIVVLASCGSNTGTDEMRGVSIESFEMLESVFEGPDSKWGIKEKLDEMFTIYKIELKDANYLKVGNQLVAIKKESKGRFREMDIINHMINAKIGEGGVSFNRQLIKMVRELNDELADK